VGENCRPPCKYRLTKTHLLGMYRRMRNKATLKALMDHPMFEDHPQHAAYTARIASLEADGLTTSDAQGTADAEYRFGFFNLIGKEAA
jgi:hypothetical protein